MCRDVSCLFSLITLIFERSNRGFKWQILSCPSLVYRISFWQNNCIVTEEGDKFCRCHFGGSIQLLRALFCLSCLLVCKRTGCGKRSLLYISPLLSFWLKYSPQKSSAIAPCGYGNASSSSLATRGYGGYYIPWIQEKKDFYVKRISCSFSWTLKNVKMSC